MKSSKAEIMNMRDYFDISRFWLLLKLELFRSKKAVLMTLVISIGLLFLFGMVLEIVVERPVVFSTHEENYIYNLIIGGFILSSLAFNDLGNSLRRYNYLILPASTLEKFVSLWLLTSFGWIILHTIIYTLYTIIANQIGALLFTQVTFLPFDPFSSFSILTIKSYFVLQGIFMIGAVHFRGYAFPKTLFVLILFCVICGTVAYLIMVELFLSDHVCNAEGCELVSKMEVHPVWWLTKGVFWWIVAPLSWVITYLGLKDQEV